MVHISCATYDLRVVQTAVPLEKAVVCRETATGTYSVSAFWISRIALYFCTVLALGCLVVPIVYSMIGFRADFDRVMACYAVWVLLAFFAMVLALAVGAMVSNVQAAVQKVHLVVSLPHSVEWQCVMLWLSPGPSNCRVACPDSWGFNSEARDKRLSDLDLLHQPSCLCVQDLSVQCSTWMF